MGWWIQNNPNQKNPLGIYDRERRKERIEINDMKMEYELNGNLEYEKSHPSFHIKKPNYLKKIINGVI